MLLERRGEVRTRELGSGRPRLPSLRQLAADPGGRAVGGRLAAGCGAGGGGVGASEGA